MDHGYINNFEYFWSKRMYLAKILREHKRELQFQWFWLADRHKREENINITACLNPFSRSGDYLRQEQGFELIGDALANYAARDWNFLPKTETRNGQMISHDSAAFEVYIKDINNISRIYVKIAVYENAHIKNLRTGENFFGFRVKLWSFKPPRK